MEIVNQCHEWTYAMRREMQLIVPGVFLGPFTAASKAKLPYLLENGITHIVCVRHQVEARYIHPNFPQHFKYHIVEFADHPCENIIQHIPSVITFINEALNNGGKVLVHGNTGISRSAALVIAYVMVKCDISFSDAQRSVRKCRSCIMPNQGFVDQLKEYEPIYKAQFMTKPNSLDSSNSGLKRSCSGDDFSKPHNTMQRTS